MAKGLFKRGTIWWLRYSDGNGKIIRESSKTTSFRDAETELIKRKKAIREGNEPEPVKKIPELYFLSACGRQRSFRSKKGFVLQLDDRSQEFNHDPEIFPPCTLTHGKSS
jgi:hypothetical protein